MKKKMEPKGNPKTTWKLHGKYLKTTYCDPGTYVGPGSGRKVVGMVQENTITEWGMKDGDGIIIVGVNQYIFLVNVPGEVT
nr:hypothetical protein [Sediminispirochaeta bajacaliforniensis]